MNWILALVLLLSMSDNNQNEESNYNCKIFATGGIIFHSIPEGYYLIASPNHIYNIRLDSNLKLDEQELVVDSRIYLEGLGLLRVEYSEYQNYGKFKYNILRYGKESEFRLNNSVRALLEGDLERNIEMNILEIVGTIVRNGMGERVYRDFKPVTDIYVDSIQVSCR